MPIKTLKKGVGAIVLPFDEIKIVKNAITGKRRRRKKKPKPKPKKVIKKRRRVKRKK